jgi:hypothetical protein
MPIYQDKNVEGLCERFGKPCLREELFVKYAERYNAEPEHPSGTMMVEGRPVAWSYFTLNIQGSRRTAALRALVRKQKKDEPGITPALAKMTAQAQLKELPCHLKCDIIAACGYCGNQHERRLIYGGTCEIKTAMEKALLMEDPKGDERDQEAGLETDYVDPRWPTDGGKNGSK